MSQCEQEVELARSLTDTTLQSALSERVEDLVIELTALRAKLAEMHEENTNLVKIF